MFTCISNSNNINKSEIHLTSEKKSCQHRSLNNCTINHSHLLLWTYLISELSLLVNWDVKVFVKARALTQELEFNWDVKQRNETTEASAQRKCCAMKASGALVPVCEDPWVCEPWRLRTLSSLLPVRAFPAGLWSDPAAGTEHKHLGFQAYIDIFN